MPKSVRTTVSIPADQYKELIRIAKDQHVSTAWVLRDAVRAYLAGRYPLFQQGLNSGHDALDIDGTAKKKKSEQ